MAAEQDIQTILAQLQAAGTNPDQIIAVLTQNFNQGVNKAKAESRTAYQEAIEAIQQYYEDASAERGEAFNEAIGELASNASNLGVDFMDSDLAREWDADQRYLTEAADTALATDLAWFEKMQTTQADLYNALLIEMAGQQALLKAAPAATGGSGGGGRSGGGGGGGSKKKEESPAFDPNTGQPLGDIDFQQTANEDQVLYNPAFDKAVDEMLGINPAQAAEINRLRRLVGTGGVVEIMKQLQEETDRLENSRGRTPQKSNVTEVPLWMLEKAANRPDADLFPWWTSEYRAAKAPGDAEENYRLMDWLAQFNPNFGPVVTKQTLDTMGRFKQNTAENQPMPDFLDISQFTDDPVDISTNPQQTLLNVFRNNNEPQRTLAEYNTGAFNPPRPVDVSGDRAEANRFNFLRVPDVRQQAAANIARGGDNVDTQGDDYWNMMGVEPVAPVGRDNSNQLAEDNRFAQIRESAKLAQQRKAERERLQAQEAARQAASYASKGYDGRSQVFKGSTAPSSEPVRRKAAMDNEMARQAAAYMGKSMQESGRKNPPSSKLRRGTVRAV